MENRVSPAQRENRSVLKGRYSVSLTLRGLQTCAGELGGINPKTATLAVSCGPQTGTRCFLRVGVNGDELYSRGEILGTCNGRVTVQLENGLSLFRKIARFEALLEVSTLKKLQKTQATFRILEEIKKKPGLVGKRRPNCWEVSRCGKEFYCPAGVSTQYDGLFGGQNGGRFCAFVDQTLCKDGRPVGQERKLKICASCFFFQEILRDATSSSRPQH